MITKKYLPVDAVCWLAETAHLSRTARSLYLELLVWCWNSDDCTVPNHPDLIKSVLSVTDEEEPDLEWALEHFIWADDSHITHRRLRCEFEEQKHAATDGAACIDAKHVGQTTKKIEIGDGKSLSSEAVRAELSSFHILRSQPVLHDRDIGPIWKLIEDGISFDHIATSICKQVVNSDRVFRYWSYFVEEIVNDGIRRRRAGRWNLSDDELPF